MSLVTRIEVRNITGSPLLIPGLSLPALQDGVNTLLADSDPSVSAPLTLGQVKDVNELKTRIDAGDIILRGDGVDLTATQAQDVLTTFCDTTPGSGGGGGGGAGTNYLFARRTGANQNIPVILPARMEFDTVDASNGVTMDTVTDVGRITLPAGGTFILKAFARFTGGATNSSLAFGWFNVTAAAFINTMRALMVGPASVSATGDQPMAAATITTAAVTEVEVQITLAFNDPDLASSSMWLEVIQIA